MNTIVLLFYVTTAPENSDLKQKFITIFHDSVIDWAQVVNSHLGSIVWLHSDSNWTQSLKSSAGWTVQ